MEAQDKARIEKFITITEKVRLSRFVRSREKTSLQISFQANHPITQALSGFDEDDLRSMLLDLRKLTLIRDGVNIVEICELLLAGANDQNYKDKISKCVDVYNQLSSRPAIKLIINSNTSTAQEIMDQWLYGHYFHEDKEKKEHLDSLGVITEFHKFNFIDSIDKLTHLAIIVASNAKLIISENE